MKKNHVIVTGGAGFIGSELVRQLKEKGFKVTIVDNLVNGKKENLSGVLDDNLKLVVDDIRNLETMKAILEKHEMVFHLACLGVRHSIHSPIENHEVNATATLNLLKLSHAAKIKKFIFVSTSEVYGTASQVPMTENHPTFPCTVYGASKLAGECYARAFFKTYCFPTVIVRPFNAYGPRSHHEGDSGEVIPKFVLRSLAKKPLIVFGDGNQTRDFTYVSDIAKGILLAAMSNNSGGETFNIGSGSEISINELAKKIVKLNSGQHSEIIHEKSRPGDVLRLYASTKKAQDTLGYKSEISFEEGLKKLKKWYLSLDQKPLEYLRGEKEINWE